MKRAQTDRAVREGYLTIRDNPFWLHFTAAVAQKQQYLQQRLLAAKDWQEYSSLRGELQALRAVEDIWQTVIAGTQGDVPAAASGDRQEGWQDGQEG
ncbi:MAG: hypothetical protein Q4B96_06940 [Bacillota bacterium]|nr:hypothetical protein [Bacillota bacterium]